MPKTYFETEHGELFVGDSSKLVRNQSVLKRYEGQCDLIFFSPPYALTREKSYKNKVADAYIRWLKGFAKPLRRLLTPTGSLVIEIGNSWNQGSPTMATTPIEALLAFKKAAGLHLCQEFIWHNPARLPSPAQWVTIERIRVKDSFTRIWWMSPVERPNADNRRVLKPYSASMLKLLERQTYNAGPRPSEHVISPESFLTNNGGAIPANAFSDAFISMSNTRVDEAYRQHCKEHGLQQHPARMPPQLAEYFIKLTTNENDLVFDPFAGSNTTGATAEKLGRRWLSFELSEEYARGSLVRFDLDLLSDEDEPALGAV